MPSWWKIIYWHHTKKINKLFETCMSERLYWCTNQYLLISAAANIRASWLKFVESQFFQRYFRCYWLFFWNAGPGRNSAPLEHLEETTMPLRWHGHIESACAMNETVLCDKCIDFKSKIIINSFLPNQLMLEWLFHSI